MYTLLLTGKLAEVIHRLNLNKQKNMQLFLNHKFAEAQFGSSTWIEGLARNLDVVI
jgi:hypothetical protein